MNLFSDPRWSEAFAHLPDYLGNHVRVSITALALGFAHSFDRERSADILVHFAPYQLITEEARGTSHGTAYAHDAHVPLIAYGVSVTPGRREERARTVDVAPTLAALLGVSTPNDLDGASLDLALGAAQGFPARSTAQ